MNKALLHVKGYRSFSIFTATLIGGVNALLLSLNLGWFMVDLSWLFFVLSCVTGMYLLADKLWWIRQAPGKKPWWSKWTSNLFALFVVIFIGRGFIMEPFHIPSGSMIPTLWSGDLILVNKMAYQLRSPLNSKVLYEIRPPQRFDIAVFEFPGQRNVSYIKRIVGLPGDTVSYDFSSKELAINGKKIRELAKGSYVDNDEEKDAHLFTQSDEGFEVIKTASASSMEKVMSNKSFRPMKECSYLPSKMICQVPKGHYFALGDNRDNSLDSRYWGFVPQANLIGKQVVVVFNSLHEGRVWLATK